MGILAGAAGVIGAITAFLRQMNRARTAARKLQEDQKDSDEFRREEILRRESEERKQIRDRLDALEKSQTAQSGQLEKILKRLGNLPRGF